MGDLGSSMGNGKRVPVMGKYYSAAELRLYDEYVSIYRAVYAIDPGDYPLMIRSMEAHAYDRYIKWRRKKAEKSP